MAAAIDYLHHHGLEAEVLPDGVLWVAPSERITPDIRSWIRAHKAGVLAELAREADKDAREYFAERAAIMEHDGGLSRPEAERQASSRVFEYRLAGINQWLTLLGRDGVSTWTLPSAGSMSATASGWWMCVGIGQR